MTDERIERVAHLIVELWNDPNRTDSAEYDVTAHNARGWGEDLELDSVELHHATMGARRGLPYT